MKRFLKTAIAVVVGYALMVVLITLVQETWLGGVSYSGSTWKTLFLAGLFTFLAAVVGGLTAAWISAGQAAALVMSGFVVLETALLFSTGKLGGPLWFDVVAAASLIVGILLGAESLIRFRAGGKADTLS